MRKQEKTQKENRFKVDFGKKRGGGGTRKGKGESSEQKGRWFGNVRKVNLTLSHAGGERAL